MRESFMRNGVLFVAATLLSLTACETSQVEVTEQPARLPRLSGEDPAINSATFIAHGQLLERQGNLAGAEQQYCRALELTPDSAMTYNRLGVTLNKLKRHDEASQAFRKAISLSDDSAQFYNNLGFSLYLEGKYSRAETALLKAIELSPEFRRAHMNHGLVLAKMGRYDPALAAFKRAGPEPDAYYNLAIIQTDSEDYISAAHSLEQALALNPDFTEARTQLQAISEAVAAAEAEAERARLAAEKAAREAASNNDVVLASHTDAVLMDPGLAATMFHQIQLLLQCAGYATPPPLDYVLGNIDAETLTAMFDDLIEAIVFDAPWRDHLFNELELIIGLHYDY